jgi:hypothetical protein
MLGGMVDPAMEETVVMEVQTLTAGVSQSSHISGDSSHADHWWL